MIQIQRASFAKRIAAALLDVILLSILAVGIAFILNKVTDYDGYKKKYDQYKIAIAARYDINPNITRAEYEKLTPEELERYNEANKELQSNAEVKKVFNTMTSLLFIIVVVSVLIAVLIIEFMIPMFLKDGMTLGKKIFSICLMKTNCVKISTFQLFVRTVFGKYVVEIMIPILIIMMMFSGMMGIVGAIVAGAIVITNIVLIFATKNKTLLHDIVAVTVVVDRQSQLMFSSEKEMIEYKTKLHQEEIKKKDY